MAEAKKSAKKAEKKPVEKATASTSQRRPE